MNKDTKYALVRLTDEQRTAFEKSIEEDRTFGTIMTLAPGEQVSYLLPANTLTIADLAALNEFLTLYPTWWWKIGVCDLTRDFDCAPQGHSPEVHLIRAGNVWDDGFHCDHTGTVADAIHHVMAEIEQARFRDMNAHPLQSTAPKE